MEFHENSIKIHNPYVSMSVAAPVFTKFTRFLQLHVKISYMEFHENSIKTSVADTRPQVDSRRTFGVSAQDAVFLLRKERLITTISLDEIRKQFLSLLVAQPVANHSTVVFLYSVTGDNRFFRNSGKRYQTTRRLVY